MDRALSWTRVRPVLEYDRPAEPVRPGRADQPGRDRPHPAGGRRPERPRRPGARAAFVFPPRPPVVVDGDAEELAYALLARVRQWRWDDRVRQQQQRRR